MKQNKLTKEDLDKMSLEDLKALERDLSRKWTRVIKYIDYREEF